MKKTIILASIFVSIFVSGYAQEKLTREQIMQKVSKGKPFTLVLLKPGKPMAKDDKNGEQLQMDHLANLFQLEKEGKISIFGPVMNDSTLTGIIIFNSTDKELIKTELNKDPYVKAGFMKYDLLDWFTIPGQKIPG